LEKVRATPGVEADADVAELDEARAALGSE
jgi:hypothetical protein